MVRAYWRLKFTSGEILDSSRLYSTDKRAHTYLPKYLLSHYIRPRWSEGIEAYSYELSVVPLDSPRPDTYSFGVLGSRLFHPVPEEEIAAVHAIPFRPLRFDHTDSYPSHLAEDRG